LLLSAFANAGAFAAGSARDYLKKSDDWFRSPEAAKVAEVILSYQADEGGWPKNQDTTSETFAGDRSTLKGTFDNGATTDELRFLARMAQATKDERYSKSFAKGLDHILKAQYPTGGWPQFYPPSKQYHRHITFNDNAMVRILEFLREVYSIERYSFVDAERRKAARDAFERGIECILKCQIKVDGKLTAWCAQHDEKDYSPRPARKFELTSISGCESVGIVRLLMSLEKPSAEIVAAVNGAVAWFDAVKIAGIRVEKKEDPNGPDGKNAVVVKDPAAPPLWARFYEIGTNKPLFSDRDSVPKYDLSEIGYERRNGYAWYGNWPQRLLEREYPAWKQARSAPRP
jgi:pectate lyase